MARSSIPDMRSQSRPGGRAPVLAVQPLRVTLPTLVSTTYGGRFHPAPARGSGA